jgi:hypothetical protein
MDARFVKVSAAAVSKLAGLRVSTNFATSDCQFRGLPSRQALPAVHSSPLWKLLLLFLAPALMGAGYRTNNFVVTAPTPEIAKQVGIAAEHYRKELAIEWLGYELPRWAMPCPIHVKVGQLGAGGATTFSFYPNGKGSAEVSNWDMNIQGSLERILDSVLPHEVSHTIFACHFRRPLPRWADEGAATLAEHDSEKRRQVMTVKQVLGTRRRIPLKNLLNIKEYPRDMQDVLTLYAEGYSLAELLVQEGGRPRYLKFLADAHQYGWDKAIQANYNCQGVDALEKRWHDWIMAGGHEIDLPKGQQLADASRSERSTEQGKPIVRGQKPAEDPFLSDSSIAAVESGRSRADELVAPEPRPRSVPNRKAGPQRVRVADVTMPAADERDEMNAGWHTADEKRTESAAVEAEPSAAQSSSKGPRQKRPDKHAKVADSRNSATPRQVTEWSEFPQDPRPSPFAVPGRNRSGARE